MNRDAVRCGASPDEAGTARNRTGYRYDGLHAVHGPDGAPSTGERRQTMNRTRADQPSGAVARPRQLAAVGDSHRSLNEVVTDALRHAILHGQFELGERLREARLAEMFNVSRNPIREALRVLEVEGLVEIVPRKGARIPLLSSDEIAEIIEVRAELEGMSARLAATRCTDEARTSLQRLLEEGNRAERENDIELLQEMNDRFHDRLAEVGKNRFLAEFMRSLRERTLWLFKLSGQARIIETWREHAAILQAVMSADPQLSSALAMRHVKEVGKTLTEKSAG